MCRACCVPKQVSCWQASCAKGPIDGSQCSTVAGRFSHRKRAAGQEAPTRHEKDCKKATKGGSVLPKAALLRERLEAGSLLSSQVSPAAGAAARSQATSIGSGLLQKLTARLSGSRFRFLARVNF